jgi:hypothetical protein
MSYGIEVECSARYGTEKPDWRRLRPTGREPYVYPTYDDAERDMRMCYPNLVIAEQVRVREAT